MKFVTPVSIDRASFMIAPTHRYMSMGSCFAYEMGARLLDAGLAVSNNPLGICFNPYSILKHLRILFGVRDINENLFVERVEGWVHLDFHSKFVEESKSKLRQSLYNHLDQVRLEISQSDILIFTFGTALAYCDSESGEIITNCHQQPSHRFHKVVLDMARLTRDFVELVDRHLPAKKLIMSVSPIRYTRDGLVASSLSKAKLRVFCAELEEQIQGANYFPAFELLIDELRDYRWYDQDLVHLRPEAIDYVWQRFIECYGSSGLEQQLAQWKIIQKRLQHRPHNRLSPAYLSFLLETRRLIDILPGPIDAEIIEKLQSEISELTHSK